MTTKLLLWKYTRPGVGDLKDKLITVTNYFEVDESYLDNHIERLKQTYQNLDLKKNIEYIKVYSLEREV